MKKILDLTDCKSTEQMCDKIEKQLNTKKKQNTKKPNKPVVQQAPVEVAKPEVEQPKKLTTVQKIKNWFKKLF